MNASRRLALLAAVLALPCAAGAQDLPERPWIITAIDGTRLTGEYPADITFSDGRAFGTGGCNRFTGGITLDGAALRFGPMAGTRMACAAPAMAQEEQLYAAFERVRGWRMDGAALLLTDEGQAPLLRLEPRP